MGGKRRKADSGEADQIVKESKGQGFSGAVKTKEGKPLTGQADSPSKPSGKRKGGGGRSLGQRLRDLKI